MTLHRITLQIHPWELFYQRFLSTEYNIVRPRQQSLLQAKNRPPRGVALYLRQPLVLSFGSFQSHFRHQSVHVSFIKLRGHTKERLRNRMPLNAYRNSNYFSFYGTLNFSRIGLRMPCFSIFSSSSSF